MELSSLVGGVQMLLTLQRAAAILRERSTAPNTYLRALFIAVATALLAIASVFSFTLLVQVCLATLHIWVPAAVVHYFNLRFLLRRRQRALTLPARLDAVTHKRFESNKVVAT